VGRRLVTVPVSWLLALLAIVLTPLAVPLAALFDLVTRRRGWPTIRIVAVVVSFLVIEVTSQVAVLWVWVTQPLARRDFADRNHALMHWWVGRLVRAARRVCGLRFEVEGDDDLGPGPLIVLSQHVSLMDAIIPAHVLATRHGRYVRYAFTRGLRFDPCLDIVGHRLPNCFVARGAADNAAELAALRTLATGMEEHEAAVIFPGGGLFTPDLLARAQAKLAERCSPQAEAAARFRHVLPPRPGGVLAFLAGAPDAHILIVGHVGSEQTIPFREPVRVKLWRYERGELPVGDEAKLTWVFERWRVMDDWIEEQRA
jgi:1-acyl-sn-glycerol-3-phosphate acyltransferase